MSALPAHTTPDELARVLGLSPRRVRAMARDLGACRIFGNRMVLLPEDVVFILRAARPGVSLDDMRQWLADDVAEIYAEKEAQDWKEPTGVVYFVGRQDQVKIGYTTNLAKRLVNFRSASTDNFKVLLEIKGSVDLERYFHKKFSDQVVAREWFRLAGPIQEFIARRSRTLRNNSDALP